ncbi:Ankyrin repeat-containing protein [Bacillus sp. OV166]|uniref:ankyrin repeat domain-containing protein n=1 Tax=Bacillus sp. OV166 TaxID=1882763 RepID=UPI000A2AB2C0|nr:ankyrin repeat domain-containing protein [Bacillus sp. OV166]SMQ80644.1 Ankyrin repeat-containing protein [Bacillus sp. OV166]
MDYFNLLYRKDNAGLDKFLKKHDVNEQFQGQSLLYWAVHNNNFQITKLLVNRGANVNQCDRLGRTPLLIACYFGFVEIAAFLLDNGAEIDGCLERAKQGWDNHIQTEIIELLKQWGKKC